MADKITLSFESREVVGKKVQRLRRQGILPATVYGKGVGPFAVQINERDFDKVMRRAGKTSLIDISVPGQKTQSAFIHSVQRHPVTRQVIHADLLVVDLLREITVDVPVHLIGSSEMVDRGDAVLNQTMSSMSIHALPTDLPHAIEVDISGLDSLDKSVYVRDIVPTGNYTILASEDDVVVSVTPPAKPLSEELAEEAAAAAEAEGVEPELVGETDEEKTDEGNEE